MDTLTFVNNVAIALVWPAFLTFVILNTSKVKSFISSLLEPLTVRMETIELEVWGQKVKASRNSLEKKLQLDLKRLLQDDQISRPIPYASHAEIRKIVMGIHTLEMFDFPIETIEDLGILKCMGSYHFMTLDFEKAIKYYQIANEEWGRC